MGAFIVMGAVIGQMRTVGRKSFSGRCLVDRMVLRLAAAICLMSGVGRAELPHGRALNGEYLDVPVRVVDPAGREAAGTTVTLHCMDSWAFSRPGGWNAFPATELLTTRRGECLFRIPRRIEWGEPYGDTFTAQGGEQPLERMFLTVEPGEEDAGAISRTLSTENRPTSSSSSGARRGDPWGPVVYLAETTEPVILRLTEPVTLTGTVTDEKGEPLEGVEVTVCHNLRAGTRTGAGGEIRHQTMSSGRGGRFAFPALHPRNLRLDLRGADRRVWTSVLGEEKEGLTRDFSFPEGENTLDVSVRIQAQEH